MRSLLPMALEELEELVATWGFPGYRARQLREWLYRPGAPPIDEWTNVPKELRARIHVAGGTGAMAPVSVSESTDGTKKYLFPADGDRHVETAVIPDGDRKTLCLSSQVGCARRCLFCQTGKQGLQGNLNAGAIVNQYHSLPERDAVTNIVFMGMGEPLDNVAAVLDALATLTAADAYALGKRRVTVSTIGIHPALETFLDRSDVHLALSVHSPFPSERARLVPAEARHPLARTLEVLRRRREDRKRRLTFEYTLFDGVNDSARHARELVRISEGLRVRVNLIAYHPVPGVHLAPTPPERIDAFRDELVDIGMRAFVRQSRGEDIAAACGMLKSNYESTDRGRPSR